MIYPLQEFIGAALRCRESARAGEVLGFVIDGRDWTLRYVQVRLSRDPAATVRVLPTAAFPPALNFEGSLLACLTADELAHGHALSGRCEELDRAAERALHDRLHWMPYWPAADEHGSGSLHDATRALGAPLTCCGEAFGSVRDLIVDTADWRVPALDVATGDGARRLHLPIAFIRTARWGAPATFDSDVRAAALACAPDRGPETPEAEYLDRMQLHLAGERRAP